MSLLPDSFLGTAGLSAMVVAMWTYLKTWSNKLLELVFQTVTFEAGSYTRPLLQEYLTSSYRTSPITGDTIVGVVYRYIAASKNFSFVPFPKGASKMTFFKGWRPIVLIQEMNDEGEVKKLQIRFLRGTIDLNSMMRGIYSTRLKYEEHLTARSRFSVSRLYGNRNKTEGMDHDRAHHTSITQDASITKYYGYDSSEFSTPEETDPFAGLAYDANADAVLEKMTFWKKSREWYQEKLVPWRIGALLWGPPGTGKSSYVAAVAQKLNMPIYSFDLTTFSNQDLQKTWKIVLQQAPCVVLFEDIDRIFNEQKEIINQTVGAQLTLDAILNCLQGVEKSDGICVIATANDISRLPEALGIPDATGKSTRPGRFDMSVYFGPLGRDQRLKIARLILSDLPDQIEKVVDECDGYTGAQFMKHCGDIALKAYWREDNVKEIGA